MSDDYYAISDYLNVNGSKKLRQQMETHGSAYQFSLIEEIRTNEFFFIKNALTEGNGEFTIFAPNEEYATLFNSNTWEHVIESGIFFNSSNKDTYALDKNSSVIIIEPRLMEYNELNQISVWAKNAQALFISTDKPTLRMRNLFSSHKKKIIKPKSPKLINVFDKTNIWI